MNKRITSVRKRSELTQEKFAERMGISKNYVNLIENGKKEPGDRLVSDICREFNISEEWLRYGTGPMDIPKDGKLSSYMADIVTGDDDFIRDLIEVYMELDQTSKDALKEIAKRMAAKRNGRD